MIKELSDLEIKANSAIDRMFDDFFKKHKDSDYPTPESFVSYIEAAGGSVRIDRNTFPKVWWKKACVKGKNISKGQIIQLANMMKDMGIEEVEIKNEYARTSLARVTGQDKKKKPHINQKKTHDDDIESPSM